MTENEGRETTDLSGEPEPEFALGAGIDFTDPNSPLAPLYLRSSQVAAAIALTVLFVLATWVQVWHTDVWAHLRFGESMVREGRLPTREVFSGDFADQDALYINYQWIAQGGAYLIFDWGRRLAEPDYDHQLGGGALLLPPAGASSWCCASSYCCGRFAG